MILENSSEWLGPNFVEIYLDAIGNNLKELQKEPQLRFANSQRGCLWSRS